MKVTFFDTKPFEQKYLEENLPEIFEPVYLPYSLFHFTQLTDEILESEVISVFIESDLSSKTLSRFKNLKFIVLRSTGFSHVDLVYAKEHNICVFNAPHYGDYSIAEHTFALLLSSVRNVFSARKMVKNHNIDDLKLQGIELFNKTLGVVGVGAIGSKVLEIAKSFNMNTVCYDVYKNYDYKYVDLDELCEISDIISINCPLNTDTLYMFNEEKFQKMKDGVIIINTARGEIIKTKDLYNALISKKVGYYAADVVECEGLLYENYENPVDINYVKESCFKNFYLTQKMLNMENVLITPHIAYNTLEAKKRILEISIENLISLTKFTNSAKNLILI